MDFNLTVAELKQQLSVFGAKTSGSKATLINRLRLWKCGNLSRKLYTVNIVPAIDTSDFPTDKSYIDLQVGFDRSNLQWLCAPIISHWFSDRKASAGEKKGRNLFFNDFIKTIKYCIKCSDIYFKCLCSAETKKNVDYIVRVQINFQLCQIMKANCSCPAGIGLSAACKHISAFPLAAADLQPGTQQ